MPATQEVHRSRAVRTNTDLRAEIRSAWKADQMKSTYRSRVRNTIPGMSFFEATSIALSPATVKQYYGSKRSGWGGHSSRADRAEVVPGTRKPRHEMFFSHAMCRTCGPNSISSCIRLNQQKGASECWVCAGKERRTTYQRHCQASTATSPGSAHAAAVALHRPCIVRSRTS